MRSEIFASCCMSRKNTISVESSRHAAHAATNSASRVAGDAATRQASGGPTAMKKPANTSSMNQKLRIEAMNETAVKEAGSTRDCISRESVLRIDVQHRTIACRKKR